MNSINNIISKIDPSIPVSAGYGEYIVYRENNGRIEEVDERMYRLCYDRMCQIRSTDRELNDECLKTIDPHLRTTFIPRTLYELFFLKECVREDLNRKSICPSLQYWHYTSLGEESLFYKIAIDTLNTMPSCYHCGYFDKLGDDQGEKIKGASFRLNQAIVKELNLSQACHLPLKQIQEISSRCLTFLSECYRESGSKTAEEVKTILRCDNGGVTCNLYNDKNYAGIKALAIVNERQKSMVQKAIALECSDMAKNHLILYRGSVIAHDSFVRTDGKIHSLSYGTGLFAGAMYDGDACAFYHMRKEKAVIYRDRCLQEVDQDAFAVLVPRVNYKASPFFIPTTHPLCQLLGTGEFFHARTKAYVKNMAPETIVRCNGAAMGKISEIPDQLKMDVTIDELVVIFQKIMRENSFSLTR